MNRNTTSTSQMYVSHSQQIFRQFGVEISCTNFAHHQFQDLQTCGQLSKHTFHKIFADDLTHVMFEIAHLEI